MKEVKYKRNKKMLRKKGTSEEIKKCKVKKINKER